MARPKEFDRDAVLDRAMELFWARGYEATSIGDLVDHLSIGRQSLYDTFGDKYALYLAALGRYRERYGSVGPAALDDVRSGQSVTRHVRAVLQSIIDNGLAGQQSCMLVNAVAERCPADTAVGGMFCANASVFEAAFARRFKRARDEGELSKGAEPRALARYFVSMVLGLQVGIRGGTDRRALEQTADVAVSVLT